jgi:hypothetical protein
MHGPRSYKLKKQLVADWATARPCGVPARFTRRSNELSHDTRRHGVVLSPIGCFDVSD